MLNGLCLLPEHVHARGFVAKRWGRVQADVTSSAALVQLLAVREAKLVEQLATAMAGKHVDVFDTWMKRSSDLVQAAAEASIGLVVAQAAQRSLAGVSRALRSVLDSVLRLDLLCRVRKTLDWFLVEGLVSAPEAAQVAHLLRLCLRWHIASALYCLAYELVYCSTHKLCQVWRQPLAASLSVNTEGAAPTVSGRLLHCELLVCPADQACHRGPVPMPGQRVGCSGGGFRHSRASAGCAHCQRLGQVQRR